MTSEEHVRSYKAAMRRVLYGSCSRLEDRTSTNAKAVAKLAAKPSPRPTRRGCLNVRGGGHNRRKNPKSEAVFAIFGKEAARD